MGTCAARRTQKPPVWFRAAASDHPAQCPFSLRQVTGRSLKSGPGPGPQSVQGLRPTVRPGPPAEQEGWILLACARPRWEGPGRPRRVDEEVLWFSSRGVTLLRSQALSPGLWEAKAGSGTVPGTCLRAGVGAATCSGDPPQAWRHGPAGPGCEPVLGWPVWFRELPELQQPPAQGCLGLERHSPSALGAGRGGRVGSAL